MATLTPPAPPMTTSVPSVSTSYADALRVRLQALVAANRDPERQRTIRALCALDPVYFIGSWCWTFDPRLEPIERKQPFVLYPFQVEYVRGLAWCLRNKVRSVTTKSRDMGATWLNAAFDVWGILFQPGYQAGYGSRKEDGLDRSGDSSTIFWKIRYLLDNLPPWLGHRYESAHMRVSVPALESAITGEAGRNIGRGGRTTRYTVDESAFLEDPKAVDSALSENTSARNDTSTPNGPAGPFAELATREDAHEWVDEATAERVRPRLVKFTLHWTRHPKKDQAWYEAKKIDIGDPVIIAQELDIDFSASMDGIVIPAGWLHPSVGLPYYPEEKGAIMLGLDVAEFGRDMSALVIREGKNIVWGEEWQGHELTHTAGRAIGWAEKCETRLAPHHYLYIAVDVIGVGAGVASIIAEYIKKHGKKRWRLIRVNAGATTQNPRCARLKDSLWWNMRDFFQMDGKPTTARPSISAKIPRVVATKLVTELSTPTYTLDSAGRIAIESKDKMKKRGAKSPNLADALALTFYQDKSKAPEPPKVRSWDDVDQDARFAA